MQTAGKKVLLLNMPWARVNGPCLGLSLLKPLAERESVAVDIVYLNLLWSEILCRYHAAWLGKDEFTREELTKDDAVILYQSADVIFLMEWVFSQAYYGKGGLEAEHYIANVLPRRYSDKEIRYWLGIRDLAPGFIDQCLDRLHLDDYFLVGFTSHFRQNCSSLALARLIKRKRPDIKIIFGGSNCAGVMGEALLRHFPFVDYVADGEAEFSFPALLGKLREGGSPEGIQGIVFRRNGVTVHNGPPRIPENLNELPQPDFSDFFEQFDRTELSRLVDPSVLLELSRGCWWGMKHPCRFCGSHTQSIAYRPKSAERALTEIRSFTGRYGLNRVDFTDAILGLHFVQTLLPRLADSGLDIGFFVEIKSNMKKDQIRMLRRAGIALVQPGIENFSDRVLRLMNKGVTGLQNVQCLKWCTQYGIAPYWLMLYGFPGEEPRDYEVCLEYLKRITHLRPPLSMGPIRLDRFSPYFERATEFGFVNVRPKTFYRFLYHLAPEDLKDLVYAFEYDYADGRKPAAYVAEACAFVDRWTSAPKGELLHFDLEDGTGFLADSRFNRVVDRVELDPFESLVYKSCDEAVLFPELMARLAAGGVSCSEETLRRTLLQFVEQLMMVREGDRFLSVALTVSPGCRNGGRGETEEDWLAVVT